MTGAAYGEFSLPQLPDVSPSRIKKVLEGLTMPEDDDDPDTFNTAHVLKPADDYLASLRSTQAGVLDDLRAENERLQAQLDHALNVMNDQTAGSHHVFAENKRLRAALAENEERASDIRSSAAERSKRLRAAVQGLARRFRL